MKNVLDGNIDKIILLRRGGYEANFLNYGQCKSYL